MKERVKNNRKNRYSHKSRRKISLMTSHDIPVGAWFGRSTEIRLSDLEDSRSRLWLSTSFGDLYLCNVWMRYCHASSQKSSVSVDHNPSDTNRTQIWLTPSDAWPLVWLKSLGRDFQRGQSCVNLTFLRVGNTVTGDWWLRLFHTC